VFHAHKGSLCDLVARSLLQSRLVSSGKERLHEVEACAVSLRPYFLRISACASSRFFFEARRSTLLARRFFCLFDGSAASGASAPLSAKPRVVALALDSPEMLCWDLTSDAMLGQTCSFQIVQSIARSNVEGMVVKRGPHLMNTVSSTDNQMSSMDSRGHIMRARG